jgi:hypothetical protein
MSNQIENIMENTKTQMDLDWEKIRQNEVIKCLDSGGSLQEVMESFPEFKENFRDLDTIDCSDGRVVSGRKIGIAGSGILLSEEDRKVFIEQCKGKTKVLTTHDDCGAAALKFNSLKAEEIPAGVKTADEYGTYCGQKMAEDLGAKHEYLNRDEMANEYHNETALVIDQTGKFDSTSLDGFPDHFVCTGAGLGFSAEYMKTEVKILTGIALGHHGFGEKFNPENPFHIIVSATDDTQLKVWEEIAKVAVKEFGDRVKVDGFIAPEKE